MIRLRVLVAASALLVLLGRPHAAAAQTTTDPDTIAKRTALGKTLFTGKALCATCHGIAGQGGPAGPTTKLVGRPLVHTKPTVADLIQLIKSGVDSAHSTVPTVMPARGGSRISDAEVEAVAWYVLDLIKRQPPK